MMHVKDACPRRKREIDDALTRQKIPEIIADEQEFVRSFVQLWTVLADPEELAHRVHRIGHRPRHRKQTLIPDLIAQNFCLFLAAGVGIEHGINKQVILFVKQDKGLPERGNTDAGVSLFGHLLHHGKHARADSNDVHIALSVLLHKRIFLALVGENFPPFGKELTLTARRAHVKTQKIHFRPPFPPL